MLSLEHPLGGIDGTPRRLDEQDCKARSGSPGKRAALN